MFSVRFLLSSCCSSCFIWEGDVTVCMALCQGTGSCSLYALSLLLFCKCTCLHKFSPVRNLTQIMANSSPIL